MCGIAGFLSSRESGETREQAVQRMCDAMVLRGPDDAGMVTRQHATLGMRRLAIFDPAHGHQPMVTQDGRFTIVFNGAIYNHGALRAELEGLGHTFRTRCDTEVLLAAYAQWQRDCLPRLRGMFAFAVWDDRECTLFAARDPFGIKPLYFARLSGGGLVFASSLNALVASRKVPAEIDPASVGEYLAWFSVPAPRTIYRGIANLPPGHALTVDARGTTRTGNWWHLPPATRPGGIARDYATFSRELRGQLEDTIRAHRLADVPVGAFLSGGLDSTAIVGLMTRLGGPPLKTFSIVFDEAGFSEQASARLAAQAFGTEHHEARLAGAQVAADLPGILAAFDQPTGDGINTYYASQLARQQGVTVALSGLGGDELFGGYPSFRDLPRLQRLLPAWRAFPPGVRRKVVAWLDRQPGVQARKLADFLAYARDLHELASLRRRVLPETARLELLAPDARALAQRLGPNHPMLDDFALELAGADPFQIISAWEMRTYMTDVLLRDSDVFSLAHSLELRVPFVDLPLLGWLWPQPMRFKYHAHGTKRALADAVSDLVPAAIRGRRKQGFTFPLSHWMRRELRPFLEATFARDSLEACPWLEPAAVSRLWNEFVGHRDDRAWSRVWSLAVLVNFANRRSAP
jgi:asparagine synthase (glutamine-hydrolysing)